MNKVDELQKALEQFRDFVGTTPIQDEREIILKGKILVEFQKVEELFSCFRTKETVKEQSLRKLLEILEGKAKTLPQVVETCDFIRDRECKKCFGQCEFEGTEHFKGKWVSVEDVTALLMNLLHEKVLAEEKNVEYAKLVAGQAEEYAEKNADFQLLYKYVLVNFGQRCTIYEPRCPCCKAWKCFDYLTAHEKELLAGSDDKLSPEEIRDVEASEKEFAEGKCKTFETAEDLIADLQKGRKKRLNLALAFADVKMKKKGSGSDKNE